jgi:beta-lactamase class A
VNAAVPRLVVGRPADSVSIVGMDGTTGVSVGWGTHTVMPAASVFKLTLLEGFLLRNQERGQRISDGASTALTAMIENSDNDAANEVYEALGGNVGVASQMRRLGLSATVLGPDDHWGLSTTCAADQLTLLTNLVFSDSPLSAASRAYAVGLMANVEPEQRWGVGAAADPGTGFANKNGWLGVDDDDGLWAVSSVGLIEVGGHQVLLAVLTQHDADFSDGIQLVQSLSRTVATALRSARASD